ncbi:D-alanyl-D-alanine carboxypeptidase family protein [Raoultibacter phocaeensis]|uniref:D-alanyl-D-alanine carboxypeptidase family protein n=1 Tax=Raoultibacter phocaeensis TaxID=2479841 RepID=UPI0011189D85|nr:D-alanyl-D-alanine carboxypeptidase family protein [Raoultibacter phocaeensis]
MTNGYAHLKKQPFTWYASFLACVLALTLALSAAVPSGAFADVRKADVVLGLSVDSRGLSVAQCPSIDAEYALVMDAAGTVYFERNATDPTQIASITKIMTALVALESAPLDTVVVTSARAATVGESSASLIEGDTMTLDVALKALLLSSGNDAAIAIAESVGKVIAGDSNMGGDEAYAVFIDRMNTRAAELGCIDTVFENPHGLDDGIWKGSHHSCASDVGLMAQAAMKDEVFRTIVATPNETITVTRADGTKADLYLESTDEMLKNGFDGACGIKTGFTALAGPSFAGAANRDGDEMYAIVIHSTSEAQRFTDAQTLLDWVYEHTDDYRLINAHMTTVSNVNGSAEVPVVAEVAHTEWIDCTVKATVADPEQTIDIFDLNGNISQSVEYETITGNVHAGEKVGTLTFKQRNEVMATVDLIAAEDVEAPDLFQGIGVWWDRLFRGFSGQPSVAESVLLNETPLVIDKTSAQ